MTNEKFADLFGGERRQPESIITKREMDMAASVQKVIEEVVVLLAQHVKNMKTSLMLKDLMRGVKIIVKVREPMKHGVNKRGMKGFNKKLNDGG